MVVSIFFTLSSTYFYGERTCALQLQSTICWFRINASLLGRQRSNQPFLGTDDLGRDILSRIMYGFYYTLGSALMITLLIAIIGGMIGIYAGLKKGRSFWLISHLFDTFLFMPILLIAIIIATLMEASLVNAMLAIF